MKSSYLEIRNLKKYFEKIKAVDNVSFSINQEQIVGLLGSSGCGKTTLLRVIAGLDLPDSGTVKLNGRILESEKVSLSCNKRGVGLVFQDLALWPHMTVEQHIQFVLDSRKTKENFKKYLKLVNLEECSNKFPEELSGGQQQRVALARTLAQDLNLLLLDEPLANLDIILKKEIKKKLLNLRKKLKLTIIYVTHDISELVGLADKIIIMNNGKVIQQGSLNSIKNNPKNNLVRNLISI